MAQADYWRRHGLLNQEFKIVGKNIPVGYAFDARLVRAAVTADIAGNDMQIVKQVPDKR